MIKKIYKSLIVFLVFFSLSQFSSANSLLKLPDTGIKNYKKYEDINGAFYRFLGEFRYLGFEEKEDYQKYLDRKDEQTFVPVYFPNKDKYGLIDLEKNKFDYNEECQKIRSNNLLKHLYDVREVDIRLNTLIGKSNSSMRCYFNGNNLYLPKYGKESSKELAFFVQNMEKIKTQLSKININQENKYQGQKRVLYNLYHFVAQNAEYNYDVVDKIDSDLQTQEPREVSSFFQGKKIVCDGYTKTLKFIGSFFGIDLKRIVGQKQPVAGEKGEPLDHSWLKYKGKYLDPTFEDNQQNDISDIYFLNSQKCMNLTHYKSGWTLLENVNQRYKYILDNYTQLKRECSDSVKKTLMKDRKITEMLKYLIKEKNLNELKESICDITSICDINSSSKKQFIDRLSEYRYKYSVNEEVYNINLENIIQGIEKKENKNEIKIDRSKEHLDKNEKKKLDEKVQKVKILLKKRYDNYKYVEKKVRKILKEKIQNIDMNTKKRHKLFYIYKLFAN